MTVEAKKQTVTGETLEDTNATSNKIVEYVVNGEKIELTIANVRKFLISGSRDKVTDKDVVTFMMLCKAQHLNPWVGDAFLICYGSDPNIITSKYAFLKRADSAPNYDGKEDGIIVTNEGGDLIYKKGCFKAPGETLRGGWCEVFFKNMSHSIRKEVNLEEYNTGKSIWATKPSTMICKVADVQALRDAFPNELQGMYIAEEFGVSEEKVKPKAVMDAETGEVLDA